MEIEVTNLQIVNFRNTARAYLGRKIARTKLHYACTKMLQKTESAAQAFDDAQQDARVDFAQVDEKGNLIVDEKGNYSYTKDNMKKLTAKLRELSNAKTKLEAHHTQPPKDLEAVYYEVFVPFVLSDENEPE